MEIMNFYSSVETLFRNVLVSKLIKESIRRRANAAKINGHLAVAQIYQTFFVLAQLITFIRNLLEKVWISSNIITAIKKSTYQIFLDITNHSATLIINLNKMYQNQTMGNPLQQGGLDEDGPGPLPEPNMQMVNQDAIMPNVIDWNAMAAGQMAGYMDQGQYQGDLNPENERHGRGQCTYNDGSFYNGEWLNNQKSGHGEMTYQNGARFSGQYSNNERNGTGELTLGNGNVVRAQWRDDMINGEGVYIKGGKEIPCVWENDVKFELQGGEDDNIMCLIICSILFFTLLIVGIILNLPPFFGIAGLIWACVQCELFASKTMKYLNNVKKSSELRGMLETLKKTAPQQKFCVECYHYVYRTRGIGKNRRTERSKRVTHRATEYFQYMTWLDQSKDVYSLDFMKKLPVARLAIEVNYNYSHMAWNSYLAQQQSFRQRHCYDRYQTFTEPKTVENHIPYMLVLNDQGGEQGKVPSNLTPGYGLLLSLITLNWIQRKQLQKSTKRVEWELNKMYLQ